MNEAAIMEWGEVKSSDVSTPAVLCNAWVRPQPVQRFLWMADVCCNQIMRLKSTRFNVHGGRLENTACIMSDVGMGTDVADVGVG